MLPDLRRSQMITSAEAFKTVVIDGSLKDRGMVSFARYMTPADAEAVRAYIAGRARVLHQREASAPR